MMVSKAEELSACFVGEGKFTFNFQLSTAEKSLFIAVDRSIGSNHYD
jgi:hypothetical protein